MPRIPPAPPVRGRLLGRAVPAKQLLRPQARENRQRDQGRNRGGGVPTCGQASCGNAQSRRERGRSGSEQRGEGGLLCSEPGCPGAAFVWAGIFLVLRMELQGRLGTFHPRWIPRLCFFPHPTPPPLTHPPIDPGGSPPSRPHLASAGAERSTGGR